MAATTFGMNKMARMDWVTFKNSCQIVDVGRYWIAITS